MGSQLGVGSCQCDLKRLCLKLVVLLTSRSSVTCLLQASFGASPRSQPWATNRHKRRSTHHGPDRTRLRLSRPSIPLSCGTVTTFGFPRRSGSPSSSRTRSLCIQSVALPSPRRMPIGRPAGLRPRGSPPPARASCRTRVAHVDAENVGAGLEQPRDHRLLGGSRPERCAHEGGNKRQPAERGESSAPIAAGPGGSPLHRRRFGWAF